VTPERWQQIQTLLVAALERPVAERSGFVAGVCVGDTELQRELESLLAQAADTSGFLSTPAFVVADTSATTGAAAPSTLVGKTISGRYHVSSRLGAGGMGDVYLADDAQLRCPVALKALRESEPTVEGRARLLREARAAAALRDHPNIAAIYDVLDADDAGRPPLIVMEYVEGETLSDRLRQGRLSTNEALSFARDVADALTAAHRRGIVHRDLKPANLRVTKDNRIKVLDFGLARRIATPVPTDTSTLPADALENMLPRIAGTPGYMSPEQLLGRPIGAPSDVFSLGVVLFEMLSGKRPAGGDDFMSAAEALLSRPIPRLTEFVPGIAPRVDALVARMLDVGGAKRPAAEEVAAELRELLRPSVPRAPLWRRTMIPAAVALVVGAAGIIARDPLRRVLGPGPAGPPPKIILATLPFDEPVPDELTQHLGAGITAAIAGNFGSVARITVLPPAEAVPYVKNADDFVSLRRGLGATHALRLSWRAAAPTLRLEARLYRPGVATPEWVQTLRGDPASIEQDMLGGLMRAFEQHEPFRRFSREERERLQRLPTKNGAARMAHAEARALLDAPRPAVDRAIDLLQQATALDPQFVSGWTELGRARFLKYQTDKNPEQVAQAMEALRHASAIDPDSPLVHYTLGDIQRRTGDLPMAEASFRRALRLQPEYGIAQRDLAQVLAALSRLAEAEALLRDAIRVNGHWSDYFVLGTIEYRAGKYAEAAAAFKTTTELAPANAGAFTMLGNSHYILGNLLEAVGNFEHAVQLGPNPAAYANLALAYYDAGRFKDALASYEEALTRDPKSAVNHRNIGDVKARLGRASEARSEYERAIALGNELLAINPRDVRTIALVALCEAKLNRRQDAERHIAQAVALDTTSLEAWQRSAEVHALLNQPDEALRDLTIAVARGFEPRMARKNDELASLRSRPRFEEILSNSPGNSAQKRGTLP